MSPEQMASSRDVDGRTDIWALGAILYELLAGRPPFNAESLPQLCTLILNGTYPPLREFRSGTPPSLEAILRLCLEKDPARRYANVSDFATALADFGPKRARLSVERVSRLINSANLSASGAVLGMPAASAPAAQTGGSWSETKTSAPKGSSKAIVLAVGAVALAAGVGAVFMLRSGAVAGTGVVSGAAGAAPVPTPAEVAPKNAAVPSSTLTLLPAAVPVPAEPPPASAAVATAAEPVKPGLHRPTPAARPLPPPRPAASAPAPAAPKPAAPVDLFDDRK
jgi:serine/threonine-protein kinase